MSGSKHVMLLGAGGVAGISFAGWRTLCPWLFYDLQIRNIKNKIVSRIKKDVERRRFLIRIFEHKVTECGKKPMLIYKDRIYTWEFMNQQANKVANAALQWGFQPGDTVTLFMQNEPAFIWTFLGLQKIGLGVAFLNTHIRLNSLVHCIKTCETKAIIIGSGEECFEAFNEIKDDLDVPLYLSGVPTASTPEGFLSWDDHVLYSPTVDICKHILKSQKWTSPCCYIFTSGTTGLPKPVIVNQMKALGYTKYLNHMDITADDILYTTLPLYHSSGITSLFSIFDAGATMVLRRKFSVSQFWDDVRRHQATMTNYIGEMCRFLLNQPEKPSDGDHKLRIIFGNGLRRDIWEKFVNRFKIPQVCEVFAATEGSSLLFNRFGKVGAVGRISPFMRLFEVTERYIIKYDPKTEQPIRNKDGRCIQCGPGEAGLLVTSFPKTVAKFYKGSDEINEKKLVRNVFKEGDAFFNYGDLLYYDKDYFLYFKDRLGDTFRWRGENVSTMEVANVLTGLEFIQDANVYGVEIPGNEGKAGMAAILLKEDSDFTTHKLTEIYDYCEKSLPVYARPMFLRFVDKMPLTQTFKQMKSAYVKEGFDPNLISEPVFYMHPEQRTYSQLTAENLPLMFAKARL